MRRMGRMTTDFLLISGCPSIIPNQAHMKGLTMLHQELTSQIINAFYVVYNTLGYGFLEKVYENSLAYELAKRWLRVDQQVPICVFYDGHRMGEYFADILVEDRIILELKTADSITSQHKAQLLNYLKATEVEVGLVLNFGPEPKFSRKIFTNDRKPGIDPKNPKEIRGYPSYP
jgi:GxxExxY protein